MNRILPGRSAALLEGSRLTGPRLRICIASGTFHPDSGGPPTYLLALGRELVARGHHVEVVTYGDAPSRRRYPYPVNRVPRRLPPVVRLSLFTRELWRSGRHADLLRHGLVPPDEPLERFQSEPHGARAEAVRWLQAAYARRADLVLVPSRYVARYVAGWGVDSARVRVVPNAAADPTAHVDSDRAGARIHLGLDASAWVVLTIARLTVWKGIDTLIETTRRIRSYGKPVCLVVVGDGPDRCRLESLASQGPTDAVHFVGEVPYEQVGAYLRAADVLALCSGYEGLSHVLLEAMAAGLPVVASSAGGNVELVKDAENGLLVPYKDVPATERAVLRLLEDHELAGRLATAARRGAEGRSVERMVDQTLAVFYEAVGVAP